MANRIRNQFILCLSFSCGLLANVLHHIVGWKMPVLGPENNQLEHELKCAFSLDPTLVSVLWRNRTNGVCIDRKKCTVRGRLT